MSTQKKSKSSDASAKKRKGAKTSAALHSEEPEEEGSVTQTPKRPRDASSLVDLVPHAIESNSTGMLSCTRYGSYSQGEFSRCSPFQRRLHCRPAGRVVTASRYLPEASKSSGRSNGGRGNVAAIDGVMGEGKCGRY